ncbi:MAG: 3-oxoacyl-ACP synthase [Nitrospirae bacterium]|nr:3-oxoacyl-ACP synthase [Nitrospirota bacterium]
MTAAARSSVVITGLGMRCALGQNVIQSCAAVRAGISRFREWPPADAPGGDEEMVIAGAAVVPDLGDRPWTEKLEELVTQPLLESLWMAGLDHIAEPYNSTRLGLYLSVPQLDRPGIDEGNAEEFLEEIRENILFPFELGGAKVISTGHAGVLLVMEEAIRDLQASRIEACVVGGVESLLEAGLLSSLMAESKLKTDTVPAGLIPGEAAAFVVLETAEHVHARGAETLACVTPVRTAFETTPASGDAPGRADATVRVLQEALADAPCSPSEIHQIINDLNGERWRFLEWAIADARVLTKLPPYRRLWHPADCFGDIGAATGAAHLCMAARAFRRGYAVGRAILVSNSSDSGERAATVVFPNA